MPSTTRSTFFTYPTKFGPVTIAADGTAVTAVSFGEQNLPGDRQPTALTTEAANQIMAYLAGQRSAFTVPMRPEGSAFQQEVWKAAANIPYGHTTTARALAETLGRPGSFRSVGAALRACPTPLLVPTHRIVTATGKPTDDINAALLKLEQQPLTRERGQVDQAAASCRASSFAMHSSTVAPPSKSRTMRHTLPHCSTSIPAFEAST